MIDPRQNNEVRVKVATVADASILPSISIVVLLSVLIVVLNIGQASGT